MGPGIVGAQIKSPHKIDIMLLINANCITFLISPMQGTTCKTPTNSPRITISTLGLI